jgi:hypothetical protein
MSTASAADIAVHDHISSSSTLSEIRTHVPTLVSITVLPLSTTARRIGSSGVDRSANKRLSITSRHPPAHRLVSRSLKPAT